MILGVDRLDYTKGLVNRLKAFEVLLERHPEHRGNVTFLQISVPSRTDVLEYQQLKEEMDQLIGEHSKIFKKIYKLREKLCRSHKWSIYNGDLVANYLHF